MVPVLQTERLELRGWEVDDFPAYAAFCADAKRTRYSVSGGSSLPDAWHAFTAMVGEWALNDYGCFAVSEIGSPQPAGYAGIWYPPDISEPELMWGLFDGFEGKGFATEAAEAVKVWAREVLKWQPLMSFIHPENEASIAVAKRLGANLESKGSLRGEARLIFRHT
ncbi:MAG: GNAT family N-acetyltransferase [Pseudomonadota bacterium]